MKLLYVKFVCVKVLYVKLLYVKFVCVNVVKLLYVKFVYVKLLYVKFACSVHPLDASAFEIVFHNTS